MNVKKHDDLIEAIAMAIISLESVDDRMTLSARIRRLADRFFTDDQRIKEAKANERSRRKIDFQAWNVGKGLVVADQKAARSVQSSAKHWANKTGKPMVLSRSKIEGGFHLVRVR